MSEDKDIKAEVEKRNGSAEEKDTIEIPIGKSFSKARENPWIPATVVLGMVLVFVLIFGLGGGITGNVVSTGQVGDSLVNFINDQGQGTAEVVSVDNIGGLYEVMINFDGEEIPVYVTLDGEFLILDPVPLNGAELGTGSGSRSTGGSGSGNNQRVENVDFGDNPVLGDENAPVTIIEFTDYQCPFCERHFSQTYGLIEENYIKTGKVKYVSMDFPLDFHAEAQPAAEAAECVRKQKGDSGYFKMHDKLFENQATLGDANYKKWAREISGVNGAEFDTCLDSGEFAAEVLGDLAYGQSVGITGTPGFLVNGVLVSGALPYSSFVEVIEAELAA